MQEQDKVVVGEGKYTFIHYVEDWRIHCLRYNEPWMIFEKGHKAISRLMGEYEELQAENKRLKEALQEVLLNHALPHKQRSGYRRTTTICEQVLNDIIER